MEQISTLTRRSAQADRWPKAQKGRLQSAQWPNIRRLLRGEERRIPK
ncbi:MAG: hypothetical protein J7575_09990 [Chloroflexi bacterium]|nr:hypothetical protein [Chloroflexota bacterium]